MSKIRVWTTDGQWSDEIQGLDKVYLIKKSILLNYAPEEYWDSSGYDTCLAGFELDGQPLSPDDFNGSHYKEKEWEWFWRTFQGGTRIDFSKVRFFTLPIVVLKSLQKKDTSLSEKYNQIISSAKTPAAIPNGYCLILRFEDE